MTCRWSMVGWWSQEKWAVWGFFWGGGAGLFSEKQHYCNQVLRSSTRECFFSFLLHLDRHQRIFFFVSHLEDQLTRCERNELAGKNGFHVCCELTSCGVAKQWPQLSLYFCIKGSVYCSHKCSAAFHDISLPLYIYFFFFRFLYLGFITLCV